MSTNAGKKSCLITHTTGLTASTANKISARRDILQWIGSAISKKEHKYEASCPNAISIKDIKDQILFQYKYSPNGPTERKNKGW